MFVLLSHAPHQELFGPSNYRGECEEGVSPEAFGFSLLEMGLIIYFISYKPSSELLLWHTAVGVGLKVTGS